MLSTFAIFAGSFGHASANLFPTNAPLQPAVIEDASAEATTVTASTATAAPTATLAPSVRTTTRTAVTRTRSS